MDRATIVNSISAAVALLWLGNSATAQQVKPTPKKPTPAVKAAPVTAPQAKPAPVKPVPATKQRRGSTSTERATAAPSPKKQENPLASMRALTQEQRKLLVDIRRRERELQTSNETVKTKLEELTAKQKELQAQLRALHESRADIYKEADPQITRLYERQGQVRNELSDIRTKLRSSRRPGRGRSGSRPPMAPRRSSKHPTLVRPGTPAGPPALPAGPPPAPTAKPPAAPTVKPPPAPAAKPTK